MTRRRVSVALLMLMAIFLAVSAYVADWNETHIYNPRWPPHAKFHNAQTMLLASLLGAVTLFFTWSRLGESDTNLMAAGLAASGSGSICEAEKLRLDAYMTYLKPVLQQVGGWVTDTVKRIEDRRFAGDETTLATLDSHYGAFQHLCELCKEHGINAALPHAFDQLFQAAIKAGHAQDDFTVLSKFMR